MSTKNTIRYPLLGKQAQLFVTETCNFHCVGCPYPKLSQERQRILRRQELEPPKWQIITDYLYAQGIRLFCLIGGEPCSYRGIAKVVSNITNLHPDACVLLSTSGLHLQKDQNLRNKVAASLTRPAGRKIKNGLIISFDALPHNDKPKNSREHKAGEGIRLIKALRQEFGDQITYAANVMVCPENLADILTIQSYLQDRGIFTNLCTQQTKCFGQKPVFSRKDFPKLAIIAHELIARKLAGGLIANSIAYLSQLPGVIGLEQYHCAHEKEGSPVIDIGPGGQVRFCNWLGQGSPDGPPGVDIGQLMSGAVSWRHFFRQSKEVTGRLCRGCSWSRRDRHIEPMVNINPAISELQNLWVKTQLS